MYSFDNLEALNPNDNFRLISITWSFFNLEFILFSPIFDVPINPIDNFLEFKYKIYASIGIPIYRQHIWFKYQDRSYVVKYNILLHKQLEVIDITTLNKFYKVDNKVDNKIDNRVNFESIEGIPIITNYYNNKDFII